MQKTHESRLDSSAPAVTLGETHNGTEQPAANPREEDIREDRRDTRDGGRANRGRQERDSGTTAQQTHNSLALLRYSRSSTLYCPFVLLDPFLLPSFSWFPFSFALVVPFLLPFPLFLPSFLFSETFAMFGGAESLLRSGPGRLETALCGGKKTDATPGCPRRNETTPSSLAVVTQESQVKTDATREDPNTHTHADTSVTKKHSRIFSDLGLRFRGLFLAFPCPQPERTFRFLWLFVGNRRAEER